MTSDDAFYAKFRDSVVEKEGNDGEEKICEDRVSFHHQQYKMIPREHKNLFCNIARGFPTPPIYAFLAIGVIGTNIARYSVVRRIGATRKQGERTGGFYNFIAPSRLGKGIAMSIITEIGTYIEELRTERYATRLAEEPRTDENGNPISRAAIAERSEMLRPHAFFLTGANGLYWYPR